MVKYIDIELLKKEINRLYQEHSTRDYCDEACSVLDKLEDFIDSLQQEQPSERFEKELAKVIVEVVDNKDGEGVRCERAYRICSRCCSYG